MKRGWVFIVAGALLLLLAGVLLGQSLGGLASNWAYDMTGVRAAQKLDLDGRGIVVAVVDTGFDPTHPSLKEAKLVRWKDLVNGRTKPYDDVGHGSHVAGVIVGQGTSVSGRLQGFQMRGAAPGASLIAVKAIDAQGSGSSTDVASGIDFSVNEGADVVCLSLGSRESPLALVGDEITDAVNRALDRGIPVVAAAGNTGPASDDVESPATIDGVIAVGAVDRTKRVADFSARGDPEENYGLGGLKPLARRADPNKKPEVVAPGVDILSAWKDGQYAVSKGTSQAAPFVCGALALALQKNPSLLNQNSRSLIDRLKRGLMDSAETLGGYQSPHDPAAGYGLLRAERLLQEL